MKYRDIKLTIYNKFAYNRVAIDNYLDHTAPKEITINRKQYIFYKLLFNEVRENRVSLFLFDNNDKVIEIIPITQIKEFY